MKNFVWFVLGIGAGFVLAHYVNKDPRGHEVLADIDSRVSEFTDRIADAYREQQARLGAAAAGVSDTVSDAVETVVDAASDAVRTVKDTPTD